MSLPEIIPSALPQFVRNTPRTNFSNSIVPAGAVLLFAESDGNGGSNLIAKNPDGSFTEVGGGGGGMPNIYKCATVDTTNPTWSGYLYDYHNNITSSTLSTGLNYKYIVPVVGKIYTEDALFEIITNVPSDPFLYFPLADNGTDLIQGLIATEEGTCTYTTDQGVRCVDTGTDGGMYVSSSFISGNAPWSISCLSKIKNNVTQTYTDVIVFGERQGSNYQYIEFAYKGPNDVYSFSEYSVWTDVSVTDTAAWNHLCLTYDGTTVKAYANGVLVNSLSRSLAIVSYPYIGFAGGYTGDEPFEYRGNIKMSELKVFKRALSQTEITAEYNRLQAMVQS